MVQAGTHFPPGFPSAGHPEALPMAVKIGESLPTLKPENNTQQLNALHVRCIRDVKKIISPCQLQNKINVILSSL
jgi:hypothetical protein